jgi:nicotinate dehydrogenase subunit A
MSLPEPTAFTVNGAAHSVQAEADTPLLYVLRNDLDLKGAKFGCGLGQCGACTVLLDGHAVNACDTPLWAVAGKQVTTVEGLAADGALSSLQQAFIDEQAVQCGYCISGMLMSAQALLAHTPDPSVEQIKAALDRNLCRCGTHARIVRAIQRAAAATATGAAR